MRIGIMQTVRALWEIEPHERLKTFFLGSAFFAIIASYTIIKELKDSIFMNIVGNVKFVPYAKLFMMFGVVPLVLLYSKLVDKVRRYQLLSYFAWMYAVLGLFCALIIKIGGLGATVVEPYSLYWFFGWFFYFYIESFSPFVVGVYWAFLNSIYSPESAKRNYGLLISVSKLGGMFSSGIAWFLLSYNTHCRWGLNCTDTNMHVLLMIGSSIVLMVVPFVVTTMMKMVPGKHLHGYEAAYQFEKKQSKSGKEATGIFAGILMFVKYPYVFGIFCTIFFYEMLSSVLSYMRLGVAQNASADISGVSCFLFKVVFFTHLIGFIISLFGTRAIVVYLGERLSLLVMPVAMGTLLFYLMISKSPSALIAAFVALRSIYYAFNQPVTEVLYIPTVKDMKFKSKSWIDTFGKKLARSGGSGFNIIASTVTSSVAGGVHGIFFGSIVVLWSFVSLMLGKRYHQAIIKGEVIGAESTDTVAKNTQFDILDTLNKNTHALYQGGLSEKPRRDS